MEKVEIQTPIISWGINSEEYGLIIKDSSGKTHYFDKDGSYDGWGRKVEISEN